VSGALLLKDTAFARTFISDACRRDFPIQSYTALALINLKADDHDAAMRNANAALEQSPRNAHPRDLRLLADVLTRLREHVKALDLLEQTAVPGLLDDSTKQLLICAQRLRRHDLLLRICRELRATGEQNDQIRRLEIQLLNRYVPERGHAIIDDLIAATSSPCYFVAFRNMLAMRFNLRERLVLAPAELPAATALSPAEASLVVMPYLHVGNMTRRPAFSMHTPVGTRGDPRQLELLERLEWQSMAEDHRRAEEYRFDQRDH
jgi:tetratricopeptide (TPR) repeat protein